MGTPKRSKTFTIAAALFSTAVGVFMASSGAFSCSSASARNPIEHVYAVDDDTLLVAGSSGKDSDIRRTSQLALLELDGRLHTVIDSNEAVEVLGVADTVVWLRNESAGVHARRLPDLALVEGINAAIEAHGPLSHRAQPEGFSETHLRLLAGDNQRYLVGLDGSIEPDAPDAGWTPRGRRRTKGDPAVSHREVRALQAQAKNAGLNTPLPVNNWLEPGVFMFDDPPSVLMTSIDLVVGGHSQSLHRMATDGSLLWSASAETLANALELDGQWIHMDWVGVRDDTIFVLAEVSEFHRDGEGYDSEQHHPLLIEVDPNTGVVQATRDVAQ